jgi:hypothetical protein
MRTINTLLVTAIAVSSLAGCTKNAFPLADEQKSFSQPTYYNNKVDIVMMVDNSSSMLQYQNKLANEIPGMIASLNAKSMDYRIVVVTSDVRSSGNGNRFVGTPKVLTPQTPDIANVLKTRIQQGQTGSDLEQGLTSIKTVLSPEYLNADGAGFLRQEALLAILALSNEEDFSSGSVASYKDFFDQLKPKFKGTNQAWLLNFIGIPNLQSSCNTALGGAFIDPGLRWIELADYTGGIVSPICDGTLANAVENVRKKIVQILTDFHLEREPKIETIVVRVNGNVVPRNSVNGWDYIPNGYIVRFYGTAVPGADDGISIDFSPVEAM